MFNYLTAILVVVVIAVTMVSVPERTGYHWLLAGIGLLLASILTTLDDVKECLNNRSR
jgi:hypothetical protein